MASSAKYQPYLGFTLSLFSILTLSCLLPQNRERRNERPGESTSSVLDNTDAVLLQSAALSDAVSLTKAYRQNLNMYIGLPSPTIAPCRISTDLLSCGANPPQGVAQPDALSRHDARHDYDVHPFATRPNVLLRNS